MEGGRCRVLFLNHSRNHSHSPNHNRGREVISNLNLILLHNHNPILLPNRSPSHNHSPDRMIGQIFQIGGNRGQIRFRSLSHGLMSNLRSVVAPREMTLMNGPAMISTLISPFRRLVKSRQVLQWARSHLHHQQTPLLRSLRLMCQLRDLSQDLSQAL